MMGLCSWRQQGGNLDQLPPDLQSNILKAPRSAGKERNDKAHSPKGAGAEKDPLTQAGLFTRGKRGLREASLCLVSIYVSPSWAKIENVWSSRC